MTRLVRVTLCATAVMLAGCVGATVDSSAPVDQASSGSWATRAALPTARQEVAVAALGERIYVIGGFGAAAEPVATVEAYDVATDTWTAPAPYPVPVHHAAAAVVAGRLYVVGGYTGGRVSWSRLVSLYEYDPTRNAWVARAAMPTPRGALAVAVVGDRLHALGGDADGVTGAHEVYDPRSDRWTSAATMPTARDHLAAVAVGGRVWALGGRASFFGTQYPNVEIYESPIAQEDVAGNRFLRQHTGVAIAHHYGSPPIMTRSATLPGGAGQKRQPRIGSPSSRAARNPKPRGAPRGNAAAS